MKRPRFYYMDLNNYNDEFLIDIILYHKDVLTKIKKIIYNKKLKYSTALSKIALELSKENI